MKNVENTVFISYRRKDISWALAVYQYLSNHNYDVFFDFTSIPSGDFEQSIVSNIKARAHFVLVLTPSSLDRCNDEGDWLRREIVTAIKERRNIIPLFFDGFSFSAPAIPEKLTGELAMLNRYNGLEVPIAYFEDAMERLCNRYLNIALDAVLHPVSDDIRKIVNEQKVAANEVIAQYRDKRDGEKTSSFDSQLPSTISVEIKGGISHPIIYKGEPLPFKKSEVYSTAEDNQTQVEVHLLFGENRLAEDNVSLGKFQLRGIASAPKGVPQVELEFHITREWIFSVTAKDKASGKTEYFPPINLQNIIPPPIKDPLDPPPDKNLTNSGFNWEDFTNGRGSNLKDNFENKKDVFGKNQNFSDIFQEIFGEGSKIKPKTKGAEIRLNISLSSEDANLGTVKEISFQRNELCLTCNGLGAESETALKICTTCNGTGEVRTTKQSFLGEFVQVLKCSTCDGTGRQIISPCRKCLGKGTILGKHHAKIRIPPNTITGTTIKFSGIGNIGRQGGERGDVFVKVSTVNNK